MSAPALFDLTGKVVFVTGAAQGLGRAMAEGVVECGAAVVLNDLAGDALDATVSALAEPGATVQAAPCDVTDADGLAAAIDETVARFGRLDVVIANAGISEAAPGLLHEMPRSDWDRVTAVNLGGVYNTVRPALGQMVAQGYGKVILVASMFGLAGAAGLFPRPAYAASKGAVVNLARELALEYAPHGLQINALCPGFFRTEARPRNEDLARTMEAYTPMGRIAAAGEIKGAAVFLAAPASDFMTGQTLVIDGGVLAR